MDNQALENLKEEGFSEEEITEAKREAPESPDFPFLIFTAAVLKDIADWLTLGVGGTIINVAVAPILYLYMRKHGGRTRKKMYKKFAMAVIAGFIPIVNMFIPEWTIFVIMTYLAAQESVNKLIDFASSFPSPAKKAA